MPSESAPPSAPEWAADREILASIVASCVEAIWTKRLDGTIMSWNPAAEQLLGYSADEAIGQPVAMIVPPGEADKLALAMERLAQGEQVPHFETRRVAKDGREVPVAVSLSPLRDSDGRVVGALQVAREIASAELRRADLAERAEAEIARLREQDQFRARFINVAAHELKTPLTPIRLQVQLLQMHLKGTDPQVQDSLDILSRSVKRLITMVDDVLDAARIQATQLRIRREPLDLSALVLEASENYAEVTRSVGLMMEVQVAPAVAVQGDVVRLLQVVNNLLSNAVKFTPPGGRIALALEVTGREAIITVADTGRGLSPEQIRKLFQPFSQVHKDQEAVQKGMGLGLFIVRAIVEQHGGKVSLASKGPGLGSTVTIRLPTTGGPVPPAAAKRPRTEMGARLRDLI